VQNGRLEAADRHVSEAGGRAQITRSWAFVAGAVKVGVALGAGEVGLGGCGPPGERMACRSW
jgi:hypothetical protein